MRTIPKNLFVFLSICLLLTFFCIKNENQNNYQQTSVIQVKTVLSKPHNYIGKTISVAGNVYTTVPNKNLFMIIDINECKPDISTCDPKSCIVNPLAVTYTNAQLPDKGTKVIVKGKVMKKSGKYTFNCETIEKYHES